MKKLFILLTSLTLLIVGCGKASDKSIESFQTISAQELESVITNRINILGFQLSRDENYILPSEKWVKEQYLPKLSKFLFDYNLNTYRADANDCDDFAQYGSTVAHILNAHNKNKIIAGIAVGDFVYFDGLEIHAINIIITSDENKKINILFVEPQNQIIITLTQEEKNTCLEMYF